MTPKQNAYRFYLQSDDWRALRNSVFERDNFRCVKCPSNKNIEAHHKFYRKRFKDSLIEDLITLCEKCHEAEHKIIKENGKVVSMVQMPSMNFVKHKIPVSDRKRKLITKIHKMRKSFFKKKSKLGWSF